MDERERINEINYLIMENNRLKATVRNQQATIEQLRRTLATVGVETITEAEAATHRPAIRGRPPIIDDQTRERIRTLKQKGLPVRKIAKLEGVSIGTVSKITHEKGVI